MAFQVVLPDLGEGLVEAELQRVLVKAGDDVLEEQPLVEVMTDKATVTIPSPRRGRVTRLLRAEGEMVKVRSPLLELEVEPAQTQEPRTANTAPASGSPAATPAVRAMARQLGIDLHAVAGTGPEGRVTKEDLEAHAAPEGPTPGAPRPAGDLEPSSAAAPGSVEVVPLRGVRKRIAENMARSTRTAAQFTFVEEVDVTELARLRARVAARAEGVKVTFLPFILKAVVAALKRHPELNASLDEAKGELQLKRWYDIGIASSTPQGLMVPVVRRADQRSLLDLAREVDRLATESRAGRGRAQDMGGSTFTITSLGALGGLFATPVIHYPEVAILGVHRIRPTPVVRDGQVVIRDVMHLSLTSDHRVVDGHVAAAFTYAVIGYLEDPAALFMELI